MITLINGQPSRHIDVADRGLLYGDGVFETMAAQISRGASTSLTIECWHDHLARMITGLERLAMDADGTDLARALTQDLSVLGTHVLDNESAHLLAPVTSDMPAEKGVIKMIITRGLGGRGYQRPLVDADINEELTRIVQWLPWPEGREGLSVHGVTARLCQHRWSSNRRFAGVKHLNRLDQVLARNEWQDPAIHEGLMLNQEGYVQSGVMSNIFIQSDGVFYTPCNQVAGIDGVMAKQVKAVAQSLGHKVEQTNISVWQVMQAKGVFFTNSLNRIWPLDTLMGTEATLRLTISDEVKQLQTALDDHLTRYMSEITC